MKQHNKKHSAGFTLLELLIVIAIIGLLASVVMVQFPEAQKRARLAQAWSFSDTLRGSLQMDMAGWWSLDETSGSIAEDRWVDRSNGTYYNPQWVEGIVNNAVNFTGSGSYMSVPDSSAISPQNKMTIEFWIKTTQATGWMIYKYDATPYPGFGFYRDNANSFRFWAGGAGGSSWVYCNKPIADGIWHHVVGTAENPGNKTIYLDGKLCAQNIAGTYGFDSNQPLYVGYGSGAGTFDEVRLYKEIMPNAVIQQHYAEGLKNHQNFVMSDF